MANYSFKKEVEVFIVSGGSRYKIDVTDVEFGQTFKETSFPVKTLHTQTNVFEASAINTANVANFSFSFPAIVEADYTIIETLLLNVSQFDLFVKTAADIFKVTGCVITNGSFRIERSGLLSIDIEGDAEKVQRGQSLTGSLQSRSATKNYTIPTGLTVSIDGTNLNFVTSITLELQNEVRWNRYTTVNSAISATNTLTSMYPSGFTLSKKILSGSITEYLTNINASDAQGWSKTASIQIKAGNGQSGSSFRGFHFGPATCSFTNRVSSGDVFMQSYDWRMTQNPTNLATVLKYETD